jgi:hypothetical protein
MEVLTTNRILPAFVLLVVVYCTVLGAQTASHAAPEVNQDSLVAASFDNQVKEYMKLRHTAKAGIPVLKRTDSAHKINQHQRLLASSIRASRPEAKQGEIFTPEISQLFKRLISIAYQGTNAARINASLRHDEPVTDVRVRVNAVYPENVPLQTTPPSILLNLPHLPPELDYRIVGRELVLRDVEADIIVDYIPGAIPSS